jgi:hypothetical protein
MYEDKEGYEKYVRDQALAEIHAEQQAATKERISTSRTKMLEQHDDFLEMEAIFEIMVASDVSLIDKMLANEDGGKFAYDTAKAYKQSLIGKPTEKVNEPSETETRNKSAVDAPSLATATSVASNTQEIEKEATIDDIFADQNW